MKNKPAFTIRIVAQMTGAHPQTIRLYEAKGLITPARTPGGTRLYTQDDIDLLEEIIELSQAGVTHEGISRIISLEAEVKELEDKIDMLLQQNARLKAELGRARREQPTAIVIRATPLPPAKM